MVTLRPDLRQLLNDLDAADNAAAALTSPLTDAQFHWQPDGGRAWSVGQCLDHLATSNRVYGGAIAAAIETARRLGWRGDAPIASTFFGRTFVRSLEPPVRWRSRAPGRIAPRSTDSRDAILQAYYDAHARLRDVIDGSAGIDLNRATFPNPFLPLVRVRAGTGLRVIAAHDRRHLWQAERVTRAAGFPSTAR